MDFLDCHDLTLSSLAMTDYCNFTLDLYPIRATNRNSQNLREEKLEATIEAMAEFIRFKRLSRGSSFRQVRGFFASQPAGSSTKLRNKTDSLLSS